MFDVIEMLKKGKRVFIGCCMNAFINEKPMIFKNKKEAIKFYANYEARCYELILDEDGDLIDRLVYDPYEY